MALDKTGDVEVFSVDFLRQTTLEELEGLGWIEEETETVKNLVNQAISVFLSDRNLNNAETPIEKLAQTCNARRKRLNNLSGLNRKNLESVGVNKPEAESLPNALYPLVYLKMLEGSGFKVLGVVRDSFMELKTGDLKKNKTELIRIIKQAFADNKMFSTTPENLLEALDSLLGSYNGRTRLGALLFKEDTALLSDWEEIFPEKVKGKITEIPGETEVFRNTLITDFLKVRYFAGNPHTAPGVFVQFRKTIESYVGKTEQARLSVQKSSKAFEVSLGGETKVDRAKLETFLSDLKEAWNAKFKTQNTADELTVNAKLIVDGDAARGGMAV